MNQGIAVPARLSMACLVAGALACGTGGARSPSKAVTADSAGIRVVTYPAALFPDTVSSTPLLSIGREGDPDYEFFRISTVTPLASGNVVVANGGTAELLYYGPDGRFLRRVAGRGDGPAELGFLSAVYLEPGDTLAVMDPRRARLVYFDSAGTFVRGEAFGSDITEAMPAGYTTCVFPGLLGLLADGTRVTHGWGCMKMEGRPGRRPNVMTLMLVHPEGRDTLGTLTAMEVWELPASEGGRFNQEVLPFEGHLAWATGSDAVYVSEGQAYEVRVYDGRGALKSILRESGTPPTVTATDRNAFLRERKAQERPLPDGVPFPERFGGYEQLLVSHEGDLWARRAGPEADGSRLWTVFSADGGIVRHLVLPDVQVESVRAGRIYAYVTSDLGVQTVVVLRVP